MIHNKIKNGLETDEVNGRFKAKSENILSIKRPDLKEYFVNKEDYYKLSTGSHKVVLLKCPNCGLEKNKKIKDFVNDGFSCNRCSDGISIPNKFMFNILYQIGIDFIPEKTFDWSKNKRYDFYIPSMDMIIEVHGLQHYKKLSKLGRGYREEVENDIFKLEISKNKVKNYLIVDARYSDYEYLKESFILSMNEYFDLGCIDWNDVVEKCNKSLVVETWELFKSNLSTFKIAEKLRLSDMTIRNYLKLGTKCGFVNYIPSCGNKKVGKYSLSGEFIEEFNSLKEAGISVGVQGADIGRVCGNQRKSSKGFIWKFI